MLQEIRGTINVDGLGTPSSSDIRHGVSRGFQFQAATQLSTGFSFLKANMPGVSCVRPTYSRIFSVVSLIE